MGGGLVGDSGHHLEELFNSLSDVPDCYTFIVAMNTFILFRVV